MTKNLNEMICNVLNNTDIIQHCDETTFSIEFEPREKTAYHTVNFDGFGLINPITSQIIEINIIEDYGENEIFNRSVDIFLYQDSIALKYLTNAGISEEAANAIMQVISDFTQKKWHLTYGKERVYSFEPCDKNYINIKTLEDNI